MTCGPDVLSVDKGLSLLARDKVRKVPRLSTSCPQHNPIERNKLSIMAKETSLSYVFEKRPTAEIVPGETFRPVTSPAPTEADLKDGEVLFETYYLGMEPSMRVWLKGTPAP